MQLPSDYRMPYGTQLGRDFGLRLNIVPAWKRMLDGTLIERNRACMLYAAITSLDFTQNLHAHVRRGNPHAYRGGWWRLSKGNHQTRRSAEAKAEMIHEALCAVPTTRERATFHEILWGVRKIDDLWDGWSYEQWIRTGDPYASLNTRIY